MSVVYFFVASVVLAIVALSNAKRVGDAFRFDLLLVFALASVITLTIAGPGVSFALCIVLACVTTCAATDIASGYVYNVVTYPTVVTILAASLVSGTFSSTFTWTVITFAACGLLYALTRGKGIGLGDVKLFAVVASALGASIGEVIGGAFIIGACAVAIPLVRRRIRFGQTLPFAPFIALATMAIVPAGGLIR